jgi:hypothetical protein
VVHPWPAAELSVPLRTEVILYLYRDTVEKVPFFHGKEPQFLADLVTCLRLEYFAPVRPQPQPCCRLCQCHTVACTAYWWVTAAMYPGGDVAPWLVRESCAYG